MNRFSQKTGTPVNRFLKVKPTVALGQKRQDISEIVMLADVFCQDSQPIKSAKLVELDRILYLKEVSKFCPGVSSKSDKGTLTSLISLRFLYTGRAERLMEKIQ